MNTKIVYLLTFLLLKNASTGSSMSFLMNMIGSSSSSSASIMSLPSVDTSLVKLIAEIPLLNYTNMFINSNCSRIFNSTLENIALTNLTIFAPDDAAWNRTFDMKDFTGFNNCSEKLALENCTWLLAHNSSQYSPNRLGSCLSYFAAYLLSPQQIHLALNSTSNNDANSNATHANSLAPVNITFFNTELQNMQAANSTLYESFILVNDTSSKDEQFNNFIVANTTENKVVLCGGGNSTAKVLRGVNAKNGVLYILDDFLLPPLPLNYTLAHFNVTIPQNLNAAINHFNQKNYTIFLPLNLTAEKEHDLNLTLYTVPQLIFLNQTEPFAMNLTALDGSSFVLNSLGNNTASINGTNSVILANIPVQNGLLHFTNATAIKTAHHAGNKKTNSTRAMRAQREKVNNWIFVDQPH